ncbi:MAG: glycosyltransferase [Anaerolineae bacterium]
MRVAIIHDWLNQVGGAERVLSALKELYPQAPIYTSIYWPEVMPSHFRLWDIRPSFMDRLPLVKRRHQLFLPLYPLAFESFDLRDYDLIVSNKSGFCHGVIAPPEALHICYCLTTTRYLWDFHSYVQREEVSRLVRAFLAPFLFYLRLWDRVAADRVDHFIAISSAVQSRIAKYYRRDSAVIHPPVDTASYEAYFSPDGHDDYFLIASRLIPYKRIDLAVQAFNELGLPLVVLGEGRDRPRLEALARPNIEFKGRVSEEELKSYVARCRAFIFPGLEDFGIAPVEAQAAGRPVIAYAGGGALDTVLEGVTGTFFREQTPQALAEAVRNFEDSHFDPETIRRHASRFDRETFKQRLSRFIEEKYDTHKRMLRCAALSEAPRT